MVPRSGSRDSALLLSILSCLLLCQAAGVAAEDGWTLYSDPIYVMAPGPDGVLWCPQAATQNLLIARHGTMDIARDAWLSESGPEHPALGLQLPYPSPTLPRSMTLASEGHVYYVEGYANSKGEAEIRVYSYAGPDDISELVDDPQSRLEVTSDELNAPLAAFRSLFEPGYRLGNVLAGRFPDQCRRLLELKDGLDGRHPTNEPWLAAKPDPEGFLDCFITLLNSAVGDEDTAVTLYSRRLYSATRLPVQITDVLRQIAELGGAYNSDPPDTADANNDPWEAFRPDKQAQPETSPEVTEKIRLLNRMLIEYELEGALEGTLYRWVRTVRGYSLCRADTSEEHLTRPTETSYHTQVRAILPLMVGRHGEMLVLLGQPDPKGLALDSIDDRFATGTPFYIVGPDGELSEPLDELPKDEAFVVQGQDPEWVDVELEGEAPELPLTDGEH